MNQEKLKGHLLILAANILFAINMPVSKYLLPEHVQPEALTSMRMSFACVMFWITSLFVPYEKVPLKDLGLLCLCALCGVGLNQGLFNSGLGVVCQPDVQRSLHSRPRPGRIPDLCTVSVNACASGQ